MAETPNRWKYAPSRTELQIWLALSTLGFCLIIAALLTRGIPTGPALIEVVLFPSAFLGWAFARSVKRLIRREHP